MIVSNQDVLDYLLHRVGEKQLVSTHPIVQRALEGNVQATTFLKTFGNSDISAYIGFIDLAGFSTIVQGKSPREICAYLKPFLVNTINILTDRFAMIDKMIGDEIMFILPEIEENTNLHEILYLGQIMGGLHDLAYELRPNYTYRFGLSYGKVNVSLLKGKDYSEWSVIGEPVHVAKRLQGLDKLASPNPVCGAFGLAIGNQPLQSLLTQLQHKLAIIAGFASRFTHTIEPEPQELKGVGRVLLAYLTPKGEERRATHPN